MKAIRLTLALMALTSLTACDYIQGRQNLADERENGAYRAALADYRAGRLDAAVKGFAKAIRKSPGNASARFQYACLMQDTKKDYLAAFCAYREFLLLRPESDKAKIAQDRLALCERELARELADKYRLVGNDASAAEIAALRKELKAANARVAVAEKSLEEEQARFRTLESEHQRLVSAVKGTGASEASSRPNVVSVKDLLDEEDEETSAPGRLSRDEIAALKAEEAEETSTGSSLLPRQTADDHAKRAADEAFRAEEARAAAERAAAEKARRPPTYVVQEGDTLYKIALRFYGRVAAWRLIRDANKTLISNDGRVRAGQTITLP